MNYFFWDYDNSDTHNARTLTPAPIWTRVCKYYFYEYLRRLSWTINKLIDKYTSDFEPIKKCQTEIFKIILFSGEIELIGN